MLNSATNVDEKLRLNLHISQYSNTSNYNLELLISRINSIMNNNDTTKQNTNSADKKASQSIIISNLINEAKRLKSEGNSYFTTQNYEAAEVAYSHGLKVIQSLSSYINRKHHPNNSDNGSSTINDNDVVFNLDIISLQVAFWSNQAFVLNNIGKYEEAERICTMALDEIVKERKVYTSLMKELQEKDGIEISSSSSSASIVVVCAKVLDVLATGQVKSKNHVMIFSMVLLIFC